VESFFASLKTELIYRRRFQTRQDAQTAIFTDIEGFSTGVAATRRWAIEARWSSNTNPS
jgi:hypothetical protein